MHPPQRWPVTTCYTSNQRALPASPPPSPGLRVLDVGCGGGILAESLARLGAHVHGIDVTEANVGAARAHARGDPRVGERVR